MSLLTGLYDNGHAVDAARRMSIKRPPDKPRRARARAPRPRRINQLAHVIIPRKSPALERAVSTFRHTELLTATALASCLSCTHTRAADIIRRLLSLGIVAVVARPPRPQPVTYALTQAARAALDAEARHG